MVRSGRAGERRNRHRDPNVGTIWMPESLRNYADNRMRHTIELQRRADHVLARAEMIAPEIITNDRNRRAALPIFCRGEIAPPCWRQTENREEVRADTGSLNVLRRLTGGAANRYICTCGRSDILKNFATKLAPLLQSLFTHVERATTRTIFVLRLVKSDELFRMRKWERPQQCAFNYGKNGTVCADTESEDEHRDKTETRCPKQRTPGVF